MKGSRRLDFIRPIFYYNYWTSYQRPGIIVKYIFKYGWFYGRTLLGVQMYKFSIVSIYKEKNKNKYLAILRAESLSRVVLNFLIGESGG